MLSAEGAATPSVCNATTAVMGQQDRQLKTTFTGSFQALSRALVMERRRPPHPREGSERDNQGADLYDQSQAIPGRRRGFRDGNSVRAASYFFRHMKLRSQGGADMSNAQTPAAFTPSDFSAVQMPGNSQVHRANPHYRLRCPDHWAGFSGMYMLHSLRDRLGLSARVLEAGNGVGGTNSRQSNRLSRAGSPGPLSYLAASQAGSPYRRASWASS